MKKIKNISEQLWYIYNQLDFVICVGHLAELVTDSDIYFPTGCCNSLEHKLYIWQHRPLSSLNTLKFVSVLLEAIFVNFELRARRSKVLFSNPMLYWRIVKTMYWYCLTDLYRYVSIYWFTLVSTRFNNFHANSCSYCTLFFIFSGSNCDGNIS